jgi:choline dehydrogenase-like flavoprotein
VRERLGRVEIRYDLHREDLETFRRGIALLTELYWAAGAQRVYQPVAGVPELRGGEAGPLADRELRASDLTLMAFHPLGTARADADPDRGVVDADLRVHGVEGVHVADGSAVPSSLGVNPQITIMALATRLAYSLLDRPAPVDEPEPETIARPRITRAHVAAAVA